MRWRARSSDLPKNGRISDFAIRGQQKRFTQDDSKRLVPIEREVKGSPLPLLMAAIRNDTELLQPRVLGFGLLQDGDVAVGVFPEGE